MRGLSRASHVISARTATTALLLLLLAFQFFGRLGALPLLDNNEGMYASIARDMAQTGAFLVPRLDGLPYIEKPPLLFWLVASALRAGGEHEAIARAIPALSGVMSCVVLVLLGRFARLPRAGLIAGAMLATMPGFVLIGRTLMFDMLNTALLTAALACLWLHLDSGDRRWLRLAYPLAAAASLAKGFLAPTLFVLIAAIFWALDGARRDRLAALFDPVAVGLGLLVFLPWHIALLIEHPDYFRAYVYEEHVLRFLDRREPHDYYTGPVWYHLPRLFAFTLPWAPLLCVSALYRGNRPEERRRERFAAVWFLVILIFFSLSGAKANYYTVLAMPAAAWYAGLAVDREGVPGRALAIALGIAGLLLIAAALVLPYATPTLQEKSLHAGEAVRYVAAGFSAAALCLAVAAYLLSRARMCAGVICATAAGAALVGSLVSGATPMAGEFSSVGMGDRLAALPSDTRVFLYRDFERYSALGFYAQRRLGVIDSDSADLAFGLRHAPDAAWFPSADHFVRLSKDRSVHVAVVVPVERRAEFNARFSQWWGCGAETIGRLTLMEDRCDDVPAVAGR